MDPESTDEEMFIFHIISPEALVIFLRNKYPVLSLSKMKAILLNAPAINIPKTVLHRYHEIQGFGADDETQFIKEAEDLPAAIDAFFDVLPAASDYSEAEIEYSKRQAIECHRKGGWIA
ncbi:hypothetical protein D9M71_563020 [compost metagenome]|uniref:hypothetical protein n=1 Tax=Pseudomonas sp. BBP2017 TaxID=2109731 RepID=UPI000D127C42|nr:hypothetical protein [Pseudomonas sp. BBP2017]PSS57375.1 hypothetical protein C6382_10755 [Pseudomonas sp. BBP2017]